MAPDARETPFVKDLASSDRQTRESALESLRQFVTTHRTLTDLDLLKLWRGLFFCLWHTPHIPSPSSTHLSASLASLALALPTPLFSRFYAAFWTTMITNYTSIPQLRLDKYLYLMRLYVRAGFQYLSDHEWEVGLVRGWAEAMGRKEFEEGEGEGEGKEGVWLAPLSPSDGKVPDGVRYHVCDVWADELFAVLGDGGVGDGVEETLISPVRRLGREGRTKVVRGRAREVLEDERVRGWTGTKNGNGVRNEGTEEEWEGFGD
ncbi:MAG: hypothetical protein Q9202_001317 [Teloschistes flavicans]